MVGRRVVSLAEVGRPGLASPKAAAAAGEAPVFSESSSAGTSMSGANRQADTVRLRISSGGHFLQDARGAVKYVGGDHFLDRVPMTFKFADLAHRLAEKVDHSVSVRYQVPGEPLDEDELVAVTDDADVQEMYGEYARAVQQAPGKAPRLRVFLFPGVEEDLTPEQYQDGNAFFHEAQDQMWYGEQGSTGQPGSSSRAGARQAADPSSEHSSLSSAHQTTRAGWASPHSKQQALAVHTKAEQQQDIWGRQQLGTQEERSAEDCGVATPDAALEELRLYSSWDRAGRSRAYGLPSHISEFGDGTLPEGIQLPSYISVFGNPVRGPDLLQGHQPVLDGDSALKELPANLDWRPNAQELPPGPALGGLHRTVSNLKPIYRSVPHVPRDAVKVLGCIAEGSFGEVSLAKTQQWGELAVKWLKFGKYERHLDSFWQEADLLARLNHPNVLRLYGVVTASATDPAVVGIMTEVARGGSLTANLRSFPCPLPLRFRAQLALQIAQGMAYLHATQIVHFDLKPDNLLLDVPMQASLMYEASCHITLKVADFGLSKIKQRSFVSGVKDLRGTLPFMAPELVNDPDRITEKADCWSFGMLMWELLTLQSPFQDLAPNHLIAGLMRGDLRPAIPPFCEQAWLDLMLDCWCLNPVARPSFDQLGARLEFLVDHC